MNKVIYTDKKQVFYIAIFSLIACLAGLYIGSLNTYFSGKVLAILDIFIFISGPLGVILIISLFFKKKKRLIINDQGIIYNPEKELLIEWSNIKEINEITEHYVHRFEVVTYSNPSPIAISTSQLDTSIIEIRKLFYFGRKNSSQKDS